MPEQQGHSDGTGKQTGYTKLRVEQQSITEKKTLCTMTEIETKAQGSWAVELASTGAGSAMTVSLMCSIWYRKPSMQGSAEE